ncbi:SRPBCC family protein [Halovenus marina]|uniref:SRPBCC family protein n=1 Tax=Halovenus marina TaxID=3396621 RepID=UPI003F54A7D5
MATYDRSVRVFAPFERVWEFHSNERGLEALTPEWMNLIVESVSGPDGDPDPDVLVAGSTLRASIRPFGVGPRQRWTSLITERECADGSAYFRDRMTDGPFEHWEHTHYFYADGETTLVRDHVEYEFPTPLGPAISPLAWVGFEPMFRYRHRKTKELLESE